MPNRPPPSGVILHPGWLSASDCDELVERLSHHPRGWLTIVDEKTGEQRSDPARVTEKVALGDLAPAVIDLVKKALIEVAEPGLGCRIDSFVLPNILRYSKGGMYRPHADSEVLDRQAGIWNKVVNRDVSLLIYLNDGFRGGNISFVRFNYSHHPRKGDLLIFPSDHRYAHFAEPVESGVRYSIVSWASGSGVRKLPAAEQDEILPLR